MKTIIHGQRIKLVDVTSDHLIKVGVNLSFTQSIIVDISCFGVDAQNQLSDDRYMIFYNQKQSPCGALSIVNDKTQNSHTFQVDLKSLPDRIQKLVFTATIDDTGTMKDLEAGEINIVDSRGVAAEFKFDKGNLNQEKALIIAEIYLKGEWRFAAIAQGFNEGLGALLKHFGGQEAEETSSGANDPPTPRSKQSSASSSVASPATPPSSSGTASSSPEAPSAQKRVDSPPSTSSDNAASKISLSKITLEKKGDKKTISLKKATKNIIHINLNWDAPESKKFSFFGNSAPDLDLGCMFRLKNGEKGVIQPLGNYFGNKDFPPHILLDRDDRSGSCVQGENLRIYKPENLDFIMIFAMIYKGAKNFTTVNGRVTVTDQEGNEVYIKLDAPDPRYAFCAACSFKNTGSGLDLTKEELYFSSHREADRHFGFGFDWVKGSK
ncbi:putative Tellurium resistance protein terA [Desulfamplus magnetovallimortis]|uniref:Putative Tellurium resistance protein terA n=1 Tax=Desulfamplus magnetovallimortis TaxID=1246637 RepID=A0A1W1HAD8_9BACT|nr:TerD family protein [Desulfamplus magnetovallimortis]SLM29406.1 putative Tellurium resistance protein terA [Desulfamplus magnetovallimortis]